MNAFAGGYCVGCKRWKQHPCFPMTAECDMKKVDASVFIEGMGGLERFKREAINAVREFYRDRDLEPPEEWLANPLVGPILTYVYVNGMDNGVALFSQVIQLQESLNGDPA